MPVAGQRREALLRMPDDFSVPDAGMSDIGAKPGVSFLWILKGERKVLDITPKSKEVSSRGGILDSAGQTQKIKFSNIDVPLIVGFKLLDLKVFNLRFMGGPVASFVLDKEIAFDEIVKNPFKGADFKNMIWGLDVGLGIDVLFLTLDVRYEFVLNNIYNPPASNPAYDIKNNLFTFALGVKIF